MGRAEERRDRASTGGLCRLSGLGATHALAQLYTSGRLYINFFRPSFKLKTKTRDDARVRKIYHGPATPCDRLLACARVSDAPKERLRDQFARLDPVRLLRDIRSVQQAVSDLVASGSCEAGSNPATDLATFLSCLNTAWKVGEVRPTHRKPPRSPRWWRTRKDPFADACPLVEGCLIAEPTATAKDLLERLIVRLPEVHVGKAQLRMLRRRIKDWQAERAKDLILGGLRRAAATRAAQV